MLKRSILAAALVTALSGAALAQDVATSTDQCLEQARTLANTIQDKKIADDKLEAIETLLTKMEDQCDAKEFDAAAATSTELQSAMN